MEFQDVERYRGTCLIVPKHFRGGRRGGHFEPVPANWARRSFNAHGPHNLIRRALPHVEYVGDNYGQMGCPPFANMFSPRRPGSFSVNHMRCRNQRKFNRCSDSQDDSDQADIPSLENLSVRDSIVGKTSVTGPRPVPLQHSERAVSLSPPSSSDSVSVTSDEGSIGPAEVCLPRIIKPRKRRKKDRKPINVTTSEVVSVSQDATLSLRSFTLNTSASSPPRSNVDHNCPPNVPCCYFPCTLSFPTPPPSPAESVGSPAIYPVDEEPAWGPVNPSGADKCLLVRCHSAPQTMQAALLQFNMPSYMRTRVRNWSGPSGVFTVPDHPPTTLHPDANVNPTVPADREWIPLHEPTTRPSCVFTVLCYNVLCDKYASRAIYGYCPQWALEWNYRRKGISQEIMRYASDIITLQEVETDQFYNWFLPELRKIGYDGIFSPKSRAKHMNENERKYVDGCAIFWKTEKFTLVKEHLIEFNQLAMANHDGSQDMLNRVMTKDNIGLAALLHTTEQAWGVLPEKNQTRQSILVCTAHIHWDPEFCDVKLIQTIMLMSEIRGIVNHILEDTSRSRHQAKKELSDVHLLLCGDLNSLPASGVVEFLTKGCVSMDHTDFKGLGYKTPLQKLALSKNHNSGLANPTTNMYTHNFSLASAYDYNIMAYTNYTYDFKGIIDYIFHSCSTIRTLGVLGPIDPEWFKINKVLGCPHPNVPSDHFPLMAELELTPSHTSHQNGLLNR